MVKYKNPQLFILMLFFLIFSFYPTTYEISNSHKLKIKNRDFILEHNYYWPDFNLYLSKIRQGYENRWLAVEKYTSEPHQGSLIQIFYLYLGKLGSILKIEPNSAYQLGRIILSPLLLTIILLLITYYFKKPIWQILAFVITLISGSFPHIIKTGNTIQIARYMEWWSNIDSLQRLTFIPHILFGQIISFYLLYKLSIQQSNWKLEIGNWKFLYYILLANLTGLVFPPSLITLLGVILLLTVINSIKNFNIGNYLEIGNCLPAGEAGKLEINKKYILFFIFSLPSLLYLFIITKFLPWSALVDFHRTHPMMVPLDQYILGTGPIIILGFFGSLLAILNRQKKYYPLILWVVVTFLFASIFSVVKEQSPLRFTQTGLFIPLGILGTYFFYQLIYLSHLSYLRYLGYLMILLYLLENLLIMKTSLNWQISFISQRIGADYPAVAYPPQTMYPLSAWMDGIKWLAANTNKEDVVLSEITAGNFIPAYAGNFVYFGQSNTVDYDRKLGEIDRFFRGQMSLSQAEIFLKQGYIKYIFVGPQEAEKLRPKKLEEIYPFVKTIYSNQTVSIYSL